ncbi:hypothetical protein GNE00_15315 [Pseudomonas sp. JL972]|uniref:hypothetical protein n=1 Tax=Stutzerimonas degradans TaxID=2968968 RepID=UPI0012D99834|nr:hypothetical protein [Stutzerimonas degradans]MTZ15118.1 hypothetical protein [Stutzerimonas degradans]
MSFGLRVWSESGALRLDTDNWTFRIARIEYVALASGGSVSFTIPGLAPGVGDAFVVPAAFNPDYAALPVVDVVGEVVTVRASQKDRPNTSSYYNYAPVPAYLYVVFFR